MIVNNANLVTLTSSEPLVEGALLAVEGKTIVDFGKVGKLVDRYDDPDVLDVSGRLTLPGLVNAHDRLSLRFAPGSPSGGVRPGTPREVRELRHRIEDAMDETGLYWSAVVGLLDAVRSGVTTVFALNSSPRCVEGSLDAIERAFRDVGVRGAIASALSPRVSASALLAESRKHVESCRDRSPEMVRGLVGLEGTTALDDATLSAAADVGAPVHVVLAEDAAELDECLSSHGTTPLKRLERRGLLTSGGLCVSGCELLREDEAVLEASKVFLGHAPQAGVVGATASPDLMRAASANLSLALGTGGLGASICEEFRIAALRQRAKGHELGDAIGLAYRAAFPGNAELASRVLGVPLGAVKPGARADLVILDYWPSTPMSADSVPEHLFWGAARAPVNTVIVNGTVVYKNGRFTRLDEERLRARAREAARAMWERI